MKGRQIDMTENKDYSGACINCNYRTDPDNEGYVYCKCKESELSDGRWLMQDYGCEHTTDEELAMIGIINDYNYMLPI